MIPVLQEQREPTFAEKFAKGFGNLGQMGGTQIPEFFMQKEQKELEKRKLLEENESIRGLTGIDPTGLSPDARKEFYKEAFKNIKTTQGKENPVQDVFNTMSSMVAKNAPGVGFSMSTDMGWFPKGIEGRAMFNSMKNKIESVLVPKVNKGALARERFDFIMGQIPDGRERQRAIVGKLRGLAHSLSEEGMPIDTSILDAIPWASEELKDISSKREKKIGSEKIRMKAPNGKILDMEPSLVEEALTRGWRKQ